MLSPGEKVPLGSRGRFGTVTRLIGEGSQGSVYELDCGPAERLALKWYFPHTGTAAQRSAIQALIDQGTPSSDFLWPTQLVDLADHSAFGYLMPLRSSEFAALSDLLVGRVDAPYSTICTLGLELASAFLGLHAEGLCYKDISFGNVFFNPQTGRPLIVDNDNVGIDGVGISNVLGTRRFMAPEIVLGQARPSSQTDLFSLAVLLFYIFMVGHPLIGRRELAHPVLDEHAESILLGSDPVFLFDPDDDSNRPIESVHGPVEENWRRYPEYFRRLFTATFTQGLRDPRGGRVRESVWRATIARLRDTIVRCKECDRETFCQPENLGAPCWACAAPMRAPLCLVFGHDYLVLNADTRVTAHHLRHDYDFTNSVAQVVRHPRQPAVWGLRNTSHGVWRARVPGRDSRAVEPGQSASLVPGSVFEFEDQQATLRTYPSAPSSTSR